MISRRDLLKGFYIGVAVSMIPMDIIGLLEPTPSVVVINYRELWKAELRQWLSDQHDQMLFDYLTKD